MYRLGRPARRRERARQCSPMQARRRRRRGLGGKSRPLRPWMCVYLYQYTRTGDGTGAAQFHTVPRPSWVLIFEATRPAARQSTVYRFSVLVVYARRGCCGPRAADHSAGTQGPAGALRFPTSWFGGLSGRATEHTLRVRSTKAKQRCQPTQDLGKI